MLIYEKNIGDINLDDIKSLVEDEIDENNFIEYKRENWTKMVKKSIFQEQFVDLQIRREAS